MWHIVTVYLSYFTKALATLNTFKNLQLQFITLKAKAKHLNKQ